MKYLFAQFSKIEDLLHNKFILLFLDYDGTLTPIAETPRKAFIPSSTKELLQKLAKIPQCKIGIISGRSLKDLKNIVGVEGIVYVGNHGLEIEGPKIKFESQVSLQLRSVMRDIAVGIQKRLSSIKGVLVENKGLSLSIHYRLVAKEDLTMLKKAVFEVAHHYTLHDKISVNSGKKVYEIRPSVKWDKGKAALWLLARQQFITGENNVLPVYIGDDKTDEDAFKALNKKGLTIFVGKPKGSSAKYYLKNPREVTDLLKRLSVILL